MLNILLYLCVSGLAFFPGAGLILLGLVGSAFVKPGWRRRLAGIGTSIGIVLVAFSTTPLEYWFYGLWGAAIVCCPLTMSYGSNVLRKLAIGWAMTMTILACGAEMRFLRAPSLMPLGLEWYVVGDSLSAGIGNETKVWPEILQAEHPGMVVKNLAQAGATVSTAIHQVEKIPSQETPVLLEIGGNDLLGGTTPEEFDRNLSNLLQQVTAHGRKAVMFELPLFPTCMSFGRIQRQLAAKYHVDLIPKRYLAWVLLGPQGVGNDGLHLSEQGHRRMAEMMGGLMGR